MATNPRAGTQSIERAALLLREIAARGRFGWRLLDLAERCALDRGTTHRILRALVRERLVQQRPGDRHYLPGPLLFELSLGVSGYALFQAACRPALARLSRQFDALAIAYLRSGSEFVCAGRAGPSVYLGTALEVGTRRPLVSNAGGVAILLAMPEEEAAEVIARNLRQLGGIGADARKRLTDFARHSRKLGYANNLGATTPGVHAFGLPILDSNRNVLASIVIAGHAEDFPQTRTPEVVVAIGKEVQRLERDAWRLLRV